LLGYGYPAHWQRASNALEPGLSLLIELGLNSPYYLLKTVRRTDKMLRHQTTLLHVVAYGFDDVIL
jgi:hypothetical protein